MTTPLEKSHRELYEALVLVSAKNSSNFSLKAPRYMHEQIEAAIENAEKIIKGER